MEHLAATGRFDLKIDAAERNVGFARSAVKEKAQELLDRDALLRMSAQDFDQFSQAIKGAFKPNKALQAVMKADKVQRA